MRLDANTGIDGKSTVLLALHFFRHCFQRFFIDKDTVQSALLLSVRLYRCDHQLVQKVRQLIAEPEHSRNAYKLAAWLHLSVRTLHRQLKKKGASLQPFNDAVRRVYARGLVNRSYLGSLKAHLKQGPEALKKQRTGLALAARHTER